MDRRHYCAESRCQTVRHSKGVYRLLCMRMYPCMHESYDDVCFCPMQPSAFKDFARRVMSGVKDVFSGANERHVLAHGGRVGGVVGAPQQGAPSGQRVGNPLGISSTVV